MAAALALGTVQFGLAYGVAGRGERVPAREAQEILARAWDAGIRVLDTAPDYGDIEERLNALAGARDFSIVSKIPPLPETDAQGVGRFVAASVARSIDRLGARLRVLLFHRGEDLLGPAGNAAWEAAVGAAGRDIEIGSSCYAPDEAIAIRERFDMPIAQLPANAFDQRLAAAAVTKTLADVKIHARSMFLQGLLLMPIEQAIARVPRAAPELRRWHDWCRMREMKPIAAAIGLAKGLPLVSHCVVGIDRPAQFEEVLAAWNSAPALREPALASDDAEAFDPRRWPA